MSHQAQQQFVASVRERFPEAFRNKRVLEIGSYNINGTVRDFFTECDYTGIDLILGPGVDIVDPLGAGHWLEHGTDYLDRYLSWPLRMFDTIISAETLEHDQVWDYTLQQAAKSLKSGGLMVITCANKKRAEHGTLRSKPNDVPLPTEYYRGLEPEDLRGALPLREFSAYEFKSEGEDTYAWAVKR